MKTATTQFLQQFKGIGVMHQGLSATEGHAPTAVLHHGTLLFNLSHQGFHRPRLAAHLQSRRRTLFGAELTVGAGMLHHDTVSRETKELLRTHVDACLAANTLGLLIKHLSLRRPALGIVTPHTAQRTALHEDGCPYAWPVVDGIPLNIEYQRLSTHCFPFLR